MMIFIYFVGIFRESDSFQNVVKNFGLVNQIFCWLYSIDTILGRSNMTLLQRIENKKENVYKYGSNR